MNMRLIYLILLLAASAGAQSITNVISPFWLPATGTYQGLAGVPGGIDQYSTNYTMFCNVKVAIPGTALVAYGDGMHDDTAALRFAVQACPNGQFVYIPAGNYLITQGLYRANSSQWDGQTHPYSIIIRGDGMGKTVLLNYSGDSAITFAFDGAWAGLPLAAAPARGSTNLTTAGTFPSVPVGTWIKVQHDYDAANVYTPTNTDPQPYYVVYRDTAAQWVRVTKIAGNTVSFWPPLNEGYASDTLTIPGQNAYRSGIENLTVVQLNEVNVANIRIRYAQESWVKNVESRQARGYHISIEMCAGTEVRGCYVHEPFPNKNGANGGGGSDYGICLGFTSSGCLVEDNIALHCRHSFIMETGCGQNNVIAYNFGKDNLHEGLFTTDWQEDTDYHGGEQRWCLWEGNVVPQITADTVEGATRYVTFFRNFVTRDGLPSVKFNMYAVNLQRGSWYDTVCANVYNSTAGLASAGTPTYLLGSWQVFCIGDADTGQIGNSQDSNYKGAFGSNLLAQYTFQTKTLNKFHGNYDMTSGNFDYSADGRLLFTKSFNLASLPPSLCYPAKPAWYGTNIWPAFGGDVPGFTNLIPAQVRWNFKPFLPMATGSRPMPPAAGRSQRPATAVISTWPGWAFQPPPMPRTRSPVGPAIRWPTPIRPPPT